MDEAVAYMRLLGKKGLPPKPGGNPLSRGHVEKNVGKETEMERVARCRRKTRGCHIKPRGGRVSRRREKAGQPIACEGHERQARKKRHEILVCRGYW